MLDPRSRGALLEALRPPPGYVVDAALATTYSLDLLTLLTAPLAFSLYDRIAAREDGRGGDRLDSFALLHAVRKHAERLVVFCEAGCIARPKGYRQLLAYLEDAVVQVRAPSADGVFHPKLWVERLVNRDGDLRYRVLVLSRNLTFDRSWDTMLALDGEVADRKLAIGDSRPLGDFVDALPALAIGTRTIDAGRRRIVETMADELRRVRFEVPEGFDAMKFWPLGHDGKRRRPFADERIERLLIVSPFLASKRLASLTPSGKKHVLVSRVDELERVPKDVLDRFEGVHVLVDAAEVVDDEAAATETEDIRSCGGMVPPASGLHAKLYVADDGWRAHVWTGSANASDAAFEQNVELLVQLTGPKSRFGVEATLDGKGDAVGLRELLTAFVPPESPVEPTDTQRQLDELIRKASRALAASPWVARVARQQGPGRETFDVSLALRKGQLALPAECSVRAWPISLSEDRALPIQAPAPAGRFESCSFQALTSFFAFRVAATVGQRVQRCEFVVVAALEGAPTDRAARVLHTLLDDPMKVLRFLRMLLTLDAFEAFDLLDESVVDDDPASGATRQRESSAVPLFESLVRTFEQEPQRLREVQRLVEELRATPDGQRLLPPAFDELWAPLWSAFESLPENVRRR